MAHDDTQPKNRVILFYGVLTTLVLLMLGPMFYAYFSGFLDREVAVKVLTVPNDQYRETKAEALGQIAEGPVPIERAVELVAARGRHASPEIAPTQSDDVGAVEGWSLAKNEEAAARAAEAVARRKAAEEARRLAGEGDEDAATGEPAGEASEGGDAPAADVSPTAGGLAADAPLGAEGTTGGG